ncbi:MAG: hypothetical protein KDB68_07830 [Planctomycetes bacterium]|nr:hypothetical protein [Planctomycetota bacterium]
MSLLEFFYPEQAQAARLREIAHTLKANESSKKRALRATDELQDDINTLALVCMGIVAALVEKGLISELDLEMQLQRIDGLDAVDDKGLDPNVLRGALGLKKPEASAPRRRVAKPPVAGNRPLKDVKKPKAR